MMFGQARAIRLTVSDPARLMASIQRYEPDPAIVIEVCLFSTLGRRCYD